ncbi:ATP-binding protein [Pyrobaculum sp. 3827-6]|uniref:ATP-binding protein n=1 Tax=Pyrobaculum sp. 3827-6 TaxID=2983604 RepID=UPI0021D9256E|nr:ATP-binding protein [Pyrobaculum sp. 3827-6]MCU7787803.1 ATP-binding protein [Pyrobaculum sp. 3827-6]
MPTPIKKIAIKRIRAAEFTVAGRPGGEIELRRVNVVTGCNGAYKTSILEAATASLLLLANPEEVPSLSTIASSLRMDDLWLYKLLNDGFEISIDGVDFKGGLTPEELAQIAQQMPILAPRSPYTRGLQAQNGRETAYLKVEYLPGQPRLDVTRAGKISIPSYNFVALSTPNPLAQPFIISLTKLINYYRAAELFTKFLKELEIKFVGLKTDEFDRQNIVVIAKNRDIPIHYLGSGYAALVLMVLAATRDIVIYDNVELHLHPWLMEKAAELIANTQDVQWIISTQSREMLQALLEKADLSQILLIETGARGTLRLYDGETAYKALTKLDEDLRGNCP